jgi:hypothetical protein
MYIYIIIINVIFMYNFLQIISYLYNKLYMYIIYVSYCFINISSH